MSNSTNTRSGYTETKETLAIVPPNSPTSPQPQKSDLENIQNDIKYMSDKHNSDMKSLNEHIYAMLEKYTDTSSKTENQEEQLTDISYKQSAFEDRLEKLSINETQMQPL